MHIIIGLITALAGLLFALYRLQNSGVDLNAFNPFYWLRRRAWAKKLGAKPLHRLGNPMEAAAVLVVAVATDEVDITRDLRQNVVDLFRKEFSVSDHKANELFAFSRHLLKEAGSVEGEVRLILAPTISDMSESQRASILAMARQALAFESPVSDNRTRILAAVEKELNTR